MPTIAPGSPVSTECPPRSKLYSKCFTCFPPIILPISPGVRSHHYPHFIIGKTKTQRAHITSKHSHWDLNPGVWFQSLYFKDHLTIYKMEGRGWPSTNRGRARNPLYYPYPLSTCYQSTPQCLLQLFGYLESSLLFPSISIPPSISAIRKRYLSALHTLVRI